MLSIYTSHLQNSCRSIDHNFQPSTLGLADTMVHARGLSKRSQANDTLAIRNVARVLHFGCLGCMPFSSRAILTSEALGIVANNDLTYQSRIWTRAQFGRRRGQVGLAFSFRNEAD